MIAILSAILFVFFIGISIGGLLVSRKIDPHQTLFIAVGLSFFLFSYIGMFIGSKLSRFIGSSGMSILLGLFCLGLIGLLIWKYDPAFGYVKQEGASLSIFVFFFLLIGMELALLELSLWFSIVFTLFFVAGTIFGFMIIYRLIHRHRSSQLYALLPLLPLLFIGISKLI